MAPAAAVQQGTSEVQASDRFLARSARPRSAGSRSASAEPVADNMPELVQGVAVESSREQSRLQLQGRGPKSEGATAADASEDPVDGLTSLTDVAVHVAEADLQMLQQRAQRVAPPMLKSFLNSTVQVDPLCTSSTAQAQLDVIEGAAEKPALLEDRGTVSLQGVVEGAGELGRFTTLQWTEHANEGRRLRLSMSPLT